MTDIFTNDVQYLLRVLHGRKMLMTVIVSMPSFLNAPRDARTHTNGTSVCYFFFFLFMSDAHHGINSSTQKYQSTQSSVVLTSCRQDSGSPPF